MVSVESFRYSCCVYGLGLVFFFLGLRVFGSFCVGVVGFFRFVIREED